ncbi:acyl-CoA thioesterase [Geopseudomonas sagittaria]|uniref:Acyl-CoA thioesterase n=1 Tax=Geopseudomonas sagittaria TaxID=1135990 RepID=A0A1I5SP02_9GAMM|nr:PaaI family thioesterase [Pseudomonas sagittaria]SFP72371.1 acyl-CoA thioesterase [Pseudomonas sagittaria]
MTDVREVTCSAYSHLLGCEPVRIDDGEAEVRLPLKAELRNRAGKLHGGAIFSLVDIAMGLACSSAHGFERKSVTVECKINYMRAIDDGEVLCLAKVIHHGSRTLVVDAEVRQGDALVARAQGTFMLV